MSANLLQRICLLAIALWGGPFPAEAQTRLNNFVTEYADVAAPGPQKCEFEFDRPGWVFVRTMHGERGAYVTLDESSDRVIEYRTGGPTDQETMRYLPAGRHTVTVQGGAVARLQVRRVPEIRYCSFQYDPWVFQEGPYDWAFLQRFILPHVNTIVGTRGQDQSDIAVSWRSNGGRWMIETAAPGLDRRELDAARRATTSEEVMDGFTGEGKLERQWIDGLLVDEYYDSLNYLFDPTVEAIRRIHADPRFSGKRVDLYVAGNADQLGEFFNEATDAGSVIALEAYHPEQPTEAKAQSYLQRELAQRMAAFARLRPEAARKMVIALGIFSTPPETLDVYPFVNERVLRDMEFHLLANDPAFDGLAGVMAYTSGYANEQTLRWIGRLYRHYCIEGRTDRLSNEPYLLNHLHNSDFAEGTTDWKIQPAESGTITTRKVPHLGEWQGRFNAAGVGDNCLVMTRSDAGPNQVQQRIRNLQPGRVYTLVMYSFDLNQGRAIYGNPTFDDVTGIRIDIDNVESTAAGCYDHHFRSIHHQEPMFFNYHVRRFRATAGDAALTIADWANPNDRRGNVRRNTGINFIEVRPYLNNE
ncbi:MAG: hypothetical protein WD738_04815 [Pirellulales bacterium]